MEIRYATISKTGRKHYNEDAFKVIEEKFGNKIL